MIQMKIFIRHILIFTSHTHTHTTHTHNSSFLDLIHTDSRSRILALLNTCIFTPTAPKEIVRCLMRCAGSSPSKFKEVTVSVNSGTQGVVCSIYDVRK